MNDPRFYRAVLYRLLAYGFVYPDPDIYPQIVSETYIETLRRSARPLNNPKLVQGVAALRHAIAATRAADLDLASDYVALFARNVLCSPYGSRYLVRDVMARPRVLEEIAGTYSAFGVRVSRDHPDLPDHIGAELEFLGYLLGKELFALEAGWDAQAAICQDARARLLREHLLLWVRDFRERLHAHARLPFYPAVADVVMLLVEDDARSLGVPIAHANCETSVDVPFAGVSAERDMTFPPGLPIPEEGDEYESTFECGGIPR